MATKKGTIRKLIRQKSGAAATKQEIVNIIARQKSGAAVTKEELAKIKSTMVGTGRRKSKAKRKGK